MWFGSVGSLWHALRLRTSERDVAGVQRGANSLVEWWFEVGRVVVVVVVAGLGLKTTAMLIQQTLVAYSKVRPWWRRPETH